MDKILDEIQAEYEKARKKFPPMHSFHEGYAILQEELDEAWDEIKRKNVDPKLLRIEMTQVAAMAYAFIRELT